MRNRERTLLSALLACAVGALGLGLLPQPTMAAPQGLGPLLDIETAGNHACALAADGRILCWGDNNHGQLGDGTTVDASEPRLVPVTGTVLEGRKVVDLSVSAEASCALTSDGDAACWGLGTAAASGSEVDVLRPTTIRTYGTPLDGKPIAKLSMGANHGCALTTDGALACWGDNANNVLGTGPGGVTSSIPMAVVSDGALAGRTVTDIEAGTSTTCAIASGDAFCWGDGGSSQLGTGTSTDSAVPVAVVTAGTPLAGHTIAQLALGAWSTCARTTDDVLACWGWDGDGAVGDGGGAVLQEVALPKAVAVSGTPLAGATLRDLDAGDKHVCAATTTGSVACWGRNAAGALGTGAAVDFSTESAPVAISTAGTPLAGRSVKALSAGATTTCAVTTEGIGSCWGSRAAGETGDGWAPITTAPSTGPIGSLAGQPVEQVVAAEGAACARTTAGQVSCWGDNSNGELGRGDQTDSGVPTAVPVTGTPLANRTVVDLGMGGDRACAVTEISTIACWGGNPDPGWSTTAASVTLTGTVLAGKQVVDVEADDEHSCARTSDNVLACWGQNLQGQLGKGSASSSTTVYPSAVTTTGTPLAGKAIAEMVLGLESSCVLTTDGIVACWGDSSAGQGGAGTTADSYVPRAITTTGTPLAGKTVVDIAGGRKHYCALTSDGVVACWGGVAGQMPAGGSLVPTAVDLLPTALDGETITAIEAGSWSTCAITQSGAMTCSQGTAVSAVPVAGSVLAGGPITSLDGATAFSCALAGTTLGCWGDNRVGELGIGDPYSTVPSTLVWGSTAPVVAASPRAVSASTSGSTQVTVTWTAPVADGGSPITSYVVTPYVGSTAKPATTVAGSATSAVVSGLGSGVSHTFKVVAVNAAGQSLAATSNAAAPGSSGTVPTAPGIGSVQPDDRKVTVAWTAPTSTGGTLITGYRITPWIGGSPMPSVDALSSATSAVVTNLVNGVSYTFRVVALNSRGASPASAASAAVSPAVQSLTLTGTGQSVFGENVVLKGTSTVGNSGTMSFYDGETLLGSKSVSLGVATYPTTKLTVGSHSITVSYKATATSVPIVAGPKVHVVVQGSTTVALSSAANPAVWGQSVKLTATVGVVSPATGVPTGSVTFKEGTTVLGTATLSSGKASFTVKPTLGAHHYTASFTGATNYLASTSADFLQTVNAAPTTTVLTSTANPAVFGQSVTIKATVKTVAPGVGTPTGDVDFYDNGVFMVTKPLSAGSASLTGQKPTVGTHRYTAIYRGSTSSLGSTAAELVQTVDAAATTVTLSSAVPIATYGQAGLITATVAVVSPGSGSTAGIPVKFYDGAILIATVNVAGGKATIPIASLPRGVHTLTAVFAGNGNFTSSTSLVWTQTIL